MKTLHESILSDMESTINTGNDVVDDIAMKAHIIELLQDSEWFYIPELHVRNAKENIDKIISIYKHRGKWNVDLNGSVTCYCPEGYITDGTFSFITVSNFTVMPSKQTLTCKCMSLRYGPSIVYGNCYIHNCPNLKDLEYCPRNIAGALTITHTGIESLKYFPVSVSEIKIINNKNLKSLKTKVRRINVRSLSISIHDNGIKTTREMIYSMPIDFPYNSPKHILTDESDIIKYKSK